jgi:DNA ligase-4
VGDAWKNKSRHLCLVFFDILHLDGVSLLERSYDERRRCLESVIREIPRFVSLYPRSLGYVTDW